MPKRKTTRVADPAKLVTLIAHAERASAEADRKLAEARQAKRQRDAEHKQALAAAHRAHLWQLAEVLEAMGLAMLTPDELRQYLTGAQEALHALEEVGHA